MPVSPGKKLLRASKDFSVNPCRIKSANEFAPTEYRISHKQVTLNYGRSRKADHSRRTGFLTVLVKKFLVPMKPSRIKPAGQTRTVSYPFCLTKPVHGPSRLRENPTTAFTPRPSPWKSTKVSSWNHTKSPSWLTILRSSSA